jgi:hypothetical protein
LCEHCSILSRCTSQFTLTWLCCEVFWRCFLSVHLLPPPKAEMEWWHSLALLNWQGQKQEPAHRCAPQQTQEAQPLGQ